jgi:DNA helicase TIP49 (TBP-interacting protein)
MEMDNESLAKSILKSVNSRDLDVMSAGKESLVKSKQDQDQDEQQQDKDESEPPAEVKFEEEEDPELLDPSLFIDEVDMTKGAQLTFTF